MPGFLVVSVRHVRDHTKGLQQGPLSVVRISNPLLLYPPQSNLVRTCICQSLHYFLHLYNFKLGESHRDHYMDRSGTVQRVEYFVIPRKKG